VSGRVVSGRGYNQLERKNLEVAHFEVLAEALETESNRSIVDRLVGLFPEPTTQEAEEILEEDYEPQTIYLRDVTITVGDGATELSGIEVEFDQVLGWRLM
jgi:hypothetical protein